MRCKCADLTELEGEDARQYSSAHLVVEQRVDNYLHYSGKARRGMRAGVPDKSDWYGRHLLAMRGTGFGELRCPVTGWRFQESWGRGPSVYRIVRRPWTSVSDYLDHTIVRDRADELDRAQDHLNECVASRGESEEAWTRWMESTVTLRAALDQLYSPDFDDLIRGIPTRKADPLGAAMVFIEVDPWCFRSGYYKEKILVRLARVPVVALDRQRLQDVLIAMASQGARAEWSALCRVAFHVRDDHFTEAIRAAASVSDRDGQVTALSRLAEISASGTRRAARSRRRRRS